MSLPLVVAGAAMLAAASAYASKSLVVWMGLRGIKPSDVGKDIPLGALLRTRIYELDEVPETWTNPNAWALAVHKDFAQYPGHAQGLFSAPDHSIVFVRSMMPRNPPKEFDIKLLRHELWHLNNRVADLSSDDPFHERYARRFESDRQMPFALFPSGKSRSEVR